MKSRLSLLARTSVSIDYSLGTAGLGLLMGRNSMLPGLMVLDGFCHFADLTHIFSM